MADGLNRVMLLGNLGADPELKMTQGGQAVLKMRLATTESYLDRNRVKQEKTEWHSIVVWGKRAEALGKFLTKGARLFIEGSLQTTSWEGNDGKKHYRTEVVARNVVLNGGGSRDGARGGGSGGGGASSGSSGGARGGTTGGGGYDDADYGGEDDIPFSVNVSAEQTERWWR